jgi:hypothetical protein
MVAVVVVGLYFGLCAHLVRLNSASLYHAEQAYQSSLSRYPNRSPFPPGTTLPRSGTGRVMIPPGAGPLETWHWEMSRSYVAEIQRLFPLVSGLFISLVSLGAVAALGRLIHALFRRSYAPTTDAPSLHPVGTRIEETVRVRPHRPQDVSSQDARQPRQQQLG